MIVSFKHKGLKRLYETGNPKGIMAEHADKVRDILTVIDAARVVEDINLPTFRLHQLKGNRSQIWSVTVRANWRITFEFEDGDAHLLDYEDYH